MVAEVAGLCNNSELTFNTSTALLVVQAAVVLGIVAEQESAAAERTAKATAVLMVHPITLAVAAAVLVLLQLE
jgi:hypothetical protein